MCVLLDNTFLVTAYVKVPFLQWELVYLYTVFVQMNQSGRGRFESLALFSDFQKCRRIPDGPLTSGSEAEI